jgi:hypothetical protein
VPAPVTSADEDPDMRIPARLRSAFAVTLALALAAAGFAWAAPAPGNPPAPDRATAIAARAERMKQVQRALLMQGARRRITEAREQAERRRHEVARERALARKGILRAPTRARKAPGNDEGVERQEPLTRGLPFASIRAAAGPPLAANVIANDRGGDPNGAHVGQAEVMIAALGSNVLAAWNDGLGFEPSSPVSSTQGYGWSTDGGTTWTDGGVPPLLPSWRWASDPLVAVNEKTGDFWYCALVDVGSDSNGVAIARARFGGGGPTWSTPVLVRGALSRNLMFDKPWLAADSISGRLYLTYSVFTSFSDSIVFQRSGANPLTTWDDPLRISSGAEAGYVQGSRPVVGPSGEVYVTWYSIGKYPEVRDFMRVRRSNDFGGSFGSAATAAALYSNYGSGAPGFNRGTGITYPSIAVDRSTGPHRGRVYVAWNESVDYYDDDLGSGGSVTEREADDTPATATPFSLGQVVRGTCSSLNDYDYFSFAGTAGQTVILVVDSLSTSLDMQLRLICGDQSTRLSFSTSGAGLSDLVVYTLPLSGTYYMRALSQDGSTGGYRILTGLDNPSAGERARDHRDVFVAWSDDGASWSVPVRASDSPAGYDDWLPEVAVAGTSSDPLVGSGRPYVTWYDWRDSAARCGGASHVYLARSDDFGGSWTEAGTVSDAQTVWTNVLSDIVPNQGDYISLFADTANLWVAWADGRNGDPDLFTSRIPLLSTAALVSLSDIRYEDGAVHVTWYTGGRAGFTGGTVTRRDSTAGLATVELGPVTTAGGYSTIVDPDVIVGHRYGYTLSWTEGAIDYQTPESWIQVQAPGTASFSLIVDRPGALAGDGVLVDFTLPDSRPGTLALIDITGRRIAERSVTSGGSGVRLGEDVRPGVYFVRLTHGGRSLNRRVVVVR